MTKIHLQNKLRPSVSNERLSEAIAEIKAMTNDRGKLIAKKGASNMDQRIERLKARIKVLEARIRLLEQALIASEQDYEKLLKK